MDASKPSSFVTNNQLKSAKKQWLIVALALAAILTVGFAVWLIKFARVHYHLPVAKANGQVEYISINHNLTCIDLFTLAQNHDRAGQTNLATIDFKSGVASPGFKSLPAKLKATLIEMVDCRDTMNKQDYFDELLTHSHIGYWSKSQMPLRIYVPDNTHPDGFNSYDRREVEKCFAEWCALVPGRLSFKFVDKPADADIAFSQKATLADLSFSRSVLAHTIPLPAGPEKWGVFPASKCTIEPLRPNPEITSPDDKRAAMRHMVFLHEIGHSLGVIGHSASADDLMYFSGTALLSERDKATFRRIYAPGLIVERAEKALRERAKADDKYAILQLAQQLDEAGTASPKQLQEIFRLTRRACELGVSKAKLMLGGMYHDGNGVMRDLDLSCRYFHESCREGNPIALLALGAVYEKGDGVPQDEKLAENYYKQALRVDLNRAPIAYGNFLAYQFGDRESLERAVAFYKRSCKSDQVEAMTRLAIFYEHGEGIKKDLHEAQELRQRARKQVERLKANDAPAYFARGCAFAEIAEEEPAIKDLSAALKLKPDFRAGYLARAASYAALGNNEAACQDLSCALKLDPDCVQAYLGRAYANMGMARPASALQDVNSVLHRSKCPDSDRVYALIIGSVACRRMHDEVGAGQMLDEAVASSSPKFWPGPIARYLHGQLSEAEFAREARGYSRGTEVCFYTAMDQISRGKVEPAIKNLQWVKENGDKTFYEYPVALAELLRVAKASGRSAATRAGNMQL